MITIREHRRDLTFLLGFLAVVAALAAWRGIEKQPILSVVFGLAAVGLVGWMVYYWRKPLPFLSISPDEIWYGRIDQPGTRIARNESRRLVFREGYQNSGWFLHLADDPGQPSILMTGFDMKEVAAACVAQGWTFADET